MRRFTKYPSGYVKASRYVERTGKPTIAGVKTCFMGVPNDQYWVIKKDGKILVIIGRKMHTYWYAMEKLFLNYNVISYGKLSSVYEVVSLKDTADYDFDVIETENDYDKYHIYPS